MPTSENCEFAKKIKLSTINMEGKGKMYLKYLNCSNCQFRFGNKVVARNISIAY